MRMAPVVGRLNAITRLTSVLLPEPLDPTSAVVDPAGASNDTPFSTGVFAVYSNLTFSNLTVAAHAIDRLRATRRPHPR